MNGQENELQITIHQAKKLILLFLNIEGIINILEINLPIKEELLNNIADIREIFKEAKLNNEKGKNKTISY